jgi:Tol biopolymer transport system component
MRARFFKIFLALSFLLPILPQPAEAAAGGQILYSRRDGDRFSLRVMNEDGTGEREVPGQAAAVSLFPAVSPDGKRIAFMAGAINGPTDFEITVLNLDGTGRMTFPAGSRFSGRPCWSPDGKKLAFPAGDDKPGLRIVDRGTGATQTLTEPGVFAVAPFWLPDGKAVGYTRILDGGGTEIILAPVAGGGAEVVLKSEKLALAGSGAISPDGKRLTYLVVDIPARTASLRVWDFEGKAETTVGEAEALVEPNVTWIPTAAWGPEGKSILVSLPSGASVGVYRYALDGQKIRLTPEGVKGTGAIWLPRPQVG